MEDYLRFLHYVVSLIGTTIGRLFRSLCQTILYYFTGQSEFERIISHRKSTDFEKIARIETSLTDSASLNFALKESLDNVDWVIGRILEKEFGIDHKTFIAENRWTKSEENGNTRLEILRLNLKKYLIQILGYEQLKRLVEERRTDFYSCLREDHERLLIELWAKLRPDQVLNARISPQWAIELGFQGNDPATDFRGMGILGLEQLLYFSKHYNNVAIRIMEKSKNQEKGYPFAIVGISTTALIRDLLNSNSLKRYFVTIKADRLQNEPNIEDFHEFYCKVFYLFDQFWYASEPESIMQYVPLRKRFQDDLVTKLGIDKGINDIWRLILT